MMTELPNRDAKNIVEKPKYTSGSNGGRTSSHTVVVFPSVKLKKYSHDLKFNNLIHIIHFVL